MSKILFGTAGIPHIAKGKSHIEAMGAIRELGLDAMELEFVHGVRMGKPKAQEVGATAKELNITLTAHGPYYINLNAKEPDKLEASIKRILDTARIGHFAGAKSITFHAGFFLGEDRKKVLNKVAKKLKEISDTLKKEKIKIDIRPELTGKESQVGSLDEIIFLSKIPMVLPCIDFSHQHARTNGAYNSYKEFCKILDKLKTALGKKVLSNMHIHVSGIHYTPKGERNHLNLKESDLNYKDLLKALKDFSVSGILICESPNLEEDALLLKKTYNNL